MKKDHNGIAVGRATSLLGHPLGRFRTKRGNNPVISIIGKHEIFYDYPVDNYNWLRDDAAGESNQ